MLESLLCNLLRSSLCYFLHTLGPKATSSSVQTLVTLKNSKKKLTEQEDEELEEAEEEDFNEQDYVDALGTGTEGMLPAGELS